MAAILYTMAKLLQLTDSEKSAARKAGFKRKAPARPKISASNATLERYIERYNDWVKAAKAAIAEGKKRELLKKQIRG